MRRSERERQRETERHKERNTATEQWKTKEWSGWGLKVLVVVVEAGESKTDDGMK